MFDSGTLALANWHLTQNMFLLLRQKGTFTESEARELIEQALLNLETFQHQFPKASAQYEGARALLEALRQAAFDG